MLIGSVGRIRSFKMSRKFILYTSIFFFVYLIVSILIFYLYFDLYVAHGTQAEKMQQMEAELRDKTKSLEQDKMYIQGLRDYISTHRGESGDRGETDIAREKKPREKALKEENTPPVKTPAAPEKKEDTTPKKEAVLSSVEVRDVVFRIVDSELILDFKIANNLAEQSPAEGYVHIIAMDKNKECPPELNYTHNKLEDCVPVDYRRGQQFSIQRFKPYQRVFKISPDSEQPSFIRILVYDRSGKLILEKEFPVTNESANDTN